MSENVPSVSNAAKKTSAQRRSICTLTGIAIGFRAVYAVLVDGAQMFGSAWIAILLALLLALPTAGSLMLLRKAHPQTDAAAALKRTAGKWGTKIIGLLLLVVLLYDSAAVLRLMNAAAKYVAMPEGNKFAIMGVTALAAALTALLGVSAIANAAVMWKRLLIVLIGILIVTQMAYFQWAWLFPILGAGMDVLVRESLPAAGIFSFIVCGWLMMEPQHDQSGTAILGAQVRSALTAAVIAVLFAMLIPGMLEEPPGRGFRIGRLLMNDRAGLSLEMPYVVLIYSGMLTMLIFEVSAAAAALNLCFERMKRNICVIVCSVLSFGAAAAGLAERETLRTLAMWYYPLIAAPVLAVGIRALIQWRMRRKERSTS